MRSLTASETLAGVRPCEDERLDGAQVTTDGNVVEQEPSQRGRRAARGILAGILLGVGAWGAIWLVVSALLRHRG